MRPRPRRPWCHTPYAAPVPMPTVELLHAADAEDRQRRAAGGPAGPWPGERRPGRLRPRLVRRPHMCGARGRPRRAAPGPAQRDPDAGRAGPAGRGRTAHRADLRPGGPGRALRRPADRAGPVPAHPPDALHVGHDGPAQGRDHRHLGRGHGPHGLRGRGVGVALRPGRPAHGVLADVPHGLHPLLGGHAPLGRVARHPQSLRRRHGPRRHTGSAAHHGVPGADAPPAHPPVPRPRPRRDLRLAPPPLPRRRPLPRVGQAGHHGAGPPGRRLGVLRLDGGPVHGLPAGGLARAPRHGGPGPDRPSALHRAGRRRRRRPDRERDDLVRPARLRPLLGIGATRRPRAGPGGARRAPSATWAASTRTATST